MPNSDNLSSVSMPSAPDYGKLVRFLLEPLLENPQSLTVDCEHLSSTEKVWVRVAFEQEDKGKVFGRGGRNLKAIEVVLNTSAIDANQQIYLDVYGNTESSSSSRNGDRSGFSRGQGGDFSSRRTRTSHRPRAPKPAPQLRSLDD